MVLPAVYFNRCVGQGKMCCDGKDIFRSDNNMSLQGPYDFTELFDMLEKSTFAGKHITAFRYSEMQSIG